MFGKIQAFFLSTAVIVVLVFSAVSPGAVYADDNNPAEPTATQVAEQAQPDAGGEATQPPAVEVTPSPEEAVPTDSSQDTQPPTDVTPTADEATSTDLAQDTQPTVELPPTADLATATELVPEPQTATVPASAEGAGAQVVDTAILSAVPENTDVTVLDANGNAQPLATQAVADAIATSDPIWCPGSQAPTPGANGCTQSFPSFDALLTFLSGNSAIQGPGTIYVQQGTYQGNDPNKVIDFNTHDLSNIRNSDLSVTGGWNTSTNAVDPNAPSTFSGYTILIGSSSNPWGGSITISNITVSGSPNNGIELYSSQDVNVDNSRFERNRQTGAVIRAGRDANVRNSVFGNGDTFTSRVQMAGLDIVSGATTSLYSVVANDNYTFGVTINAGDSVFIGGTATAQSTFNGNTDVLGTNANPVFNGYGLQATAVNDIALSNVTASKNYLWGAKLATSDTGTISIADSVFNDNSTNQPIFIDDTGLFITNGGDIALSNVTANGNRLYGAQINAKGTVSISGSNFNNNVGVTTINGVTNYYGHGLQITTPLDIFISNTNATGNSLFGAQLNTTGTGGTGTGEVSISNSDFSNTSTTVATAVLGKNLEIVSNGNVSLVSVILNNSQTSGADIQSKGDVYLDTDTANNNGTDGITVQAVCVHLNGGQYTGNGQYGLNLNNSALDYTSPATFSGNGAGDIFPATPTSCTPATTGTGSTGGSNSPTGTGTTTGTDIPVTGNVVPASVESSSQAVSFNLFTGNFASQAAVPESSAKNVSLLTFLANSSDTGHGIFTGNYAFLDTDDGLQVILLVPAADDSLAMSLP